jgi:hypothetical protein
MYKAYTIKGNGMGKNKGIQNNIACYTYQASFLQEGIWCKRWHEGRLQYTPYIAESMSTQGIHEEAMSVKEICIYRRTKPRTQV